MTMTFVLHKVHLNHTFFQHAQAFEAVFVILYPDPDNRQFDRTDEKSMNSRSLRLLEIYLLTRPFERSTKVTSIEMIPVS